MIVARAPFRISLAGGGTDLPYYADSHGGLIVSAAIDKYMYIVVNRPAADDLIRVRYSRFEQVETPEQLEHDLVRHVLRTVEVDRGIEIASLADVPAGTGLGSSGTYLVALLAAIHALRGESRSPLDIAHEAAFIEMELAAHPVGRHDHFIAATGGITQFTFEQDGAVGVLPLHILGTFRERLRAGTMLFYTGITRSSSKALSAQAERGVDGVESMHLMKALVSSITDAIREGDIAAFGALLDEHWQLKRDASPFASNAQIDGWYEAARQAGALGGKIVGAGGGGFMMLVVDPDEVAAVARVRSTMAAAGLREMPFQFDFEGVRVLARP